MRRSRLGSVLAAPLLLASALAGCTSHQASAPDKPTILVGSTNSPENKVLAYIYSDALKAAGFTSTVRPAVGEPGAIEPVLEAGGLDLVVEYLGDYLRYFDPAAVTMPVTATVVALRPLVAKRGLVLGSASQASRTGAIAVTAATAAKYHLTSVADLKPHAQRWTFGGPVTCRTDPRCLAGLGPAYGVVFKAFKALDDSGPLTHAALVSGTVQAARIVSSDAAITLNDLVVLTDPRGVQGVGNVVPVVGRTKATSEVMAVLNRVSGALSTPDLIEFNVAVSAKHQDPSALAAKYVLDHDLG